MQRADRQFIDGVLARFERATDGLSLEDIPADDANDRQVAIWYLEMKGCIRKQDGRYFGTGKSPEFYIPVPERRPEPVYFSRRVA